MDIEVSKFVEIIVIFVFAVLRRILPKTGS